MEMTWEIGTMYFMNHFHQILALFESKGALMYDGEGITQLEHAWQCGQLAKDAGATPALQLASWLHDVGHLTSGMNGTPTLSGHDDVHENTGAALLHAIWGDAVSEPVRLHVQAKRYLVATVPGYAAKLSPDSIRSLALQGGPMKTLECDEFALDPYADDAKRLRAWDDAGKRPAWFSETTADALSELRVLMERVAMAKNG
jgi:phosphonate degradation associated HDIG domain protein